jgi:hypothetical protein
MDLERGTSLAGFFSFWAMITVKISRLLTRGVFDAGGSGSGGGSSGNRRLDNWSGGGGSSRFRSTTLDSSLVLELVVNLLRVFCVTEDHTSAADRVVASLVFGLERPSGHAGESGGGSNFDETLEVVDSEKKVLGLNPPDGRGELVGKEFYEDDIGKLLALFSRAPVLFIPLAKNLVETGRRGLVVNDLSVFLRDLEWLGNQVRDIASNQHIWVEVKRVDLFAQVYEVIVRIYQRSSKNQLTSPERHHAGPKVAGVERHIDAGQRDRGKASLQYDVAILLLLLLRGCKTTLDDISKHLLDLLDGELL